MEEAYVVASMPTQRMGQTLLHVFGTLTYVYTKQPCMTITRCDGSFFYRVCHDSGPKGQYIWPNFL